MKIIKDKPKEIRLAKKRGIKMLKRRRKVRAKRLHAAAMMRHLQRQKPKSSIISIQKKSWWTKIKMWLTSFFHKSAYERR